MLTEMLRSDKSVNLGEEDRLIIKDTMKARKCVVARFERREQVNILTQI
jgi:hypothetical protein